MVTASGIWKAAVPSGTRLVCGARMCVQGTATGSAAGIHSGEDVQVVTRLQDGRGRVLWLRDADVTVVGQAPP